MIRRSSRALRPQNHAPSEEIRQAHSCGRQYWNTTMIVIGAICALAVPASLAHAQNQMQTGDGLLRIQTQMPNEIHTGEQFEFRIMVENSSDNIVLHDIVLEQGKSEGFSIESTSLQGTQQQQSGSEEQPAKERQSQNSTDGKFTIKKLEPGGSQTILVKAAADKEGELRSCLQVVSYKPALCMTSTVVKPDLQITKNAPEQADRCKTIELVYTVTNDGTGDVGNFQIVDELGDGLQTIEGNSSLSFPVDGLQAGDTRQFVARVFATRPGSFSSRAVARAENSDLQARSARTTTDVVAADLQVNVDGPGRLYGESVASFTAYVTNTGNTTANDVSVNVMWPQDASLVDISDYQVRNDIDAKSNNSNAGKSEQERPREVTQTNGATQQQQGTNNGDDGDQQHNQQEQSDSKQMNSREFGIANLEPGQTATFQYAVRPRNMEEVKTQVKALYVCAVDMAEGQDQAINRVTSTGYGQATIVRLPAMQMFIVDDEDPVSDGTTVTYTIRVTNEGDATERDIRLTATLPEGLTFDSASGPTEFQNQGSKIQFQPLENMEPGTTVNFEVTAKNNGEGSVNFKATLNTESLDEEVVAEEPTRLVSR